MIMNDANYHQLADQLMIDIEEALDEIEFDIDYESASGILTLTFPNQTKIIVNKQPPKHQIWLATKFNGHHFNFEDDKWIDERFGGEFWEVINDAATKQAGQPINLKPE